MIDFGYCLQAWISYLRGAEPILGLPLCGAGVALVLAGWRLWPVASFLSLGLAGAAVGQMLSGTVTFEPLWAGAGALLLGLGNVLLPRYSATALGGIIGGAFGAIVMQSFGIGGILEVAAAALAFAGATAMAFAYRHQVVVVITSVEGGILLASGLAVMIPQIPLLHGYFRTMTATSPFMIGFFVLVPTVVGVMLQQADSNRSSSKAVRG